jgi:hypothetical protein
MLFAFNSIQVYITEIKLLSLCWAKLSCNTKSWLSGPIRTAIVGLNPIHAVVA